jgi:hypothetical protein
MLRRPRLPPGFDLRSTTPQRPNKTFSTTGNPSSRPSLHISLAPIRLDSRPSLRFDPIIVDVKEGDAPLRIGRATAPGSTEIVFNSKVISRAHAEIWAESGGKLFIRDTRSCSGTFINFSRLSPPRAESPPFQLRGGDILQFGVARQGGVEDRYKCVTVKVWIGKEPQATLDVSKSVSLSQLSCPRADIA